MGISVRTNTSAINTKKSLNKSNSKLSKSIEKLASGFQINRSADDASGLAITEKMRAQISALDTVVDGCEDGINLLKTADGYLAEIQDMVVRMTELTVKSANGVLQDKPDRQALQEEMNHLSAEIDRISTTANFNGNKILDGNKKSDIVSNYSLSLYPKTNLLMDNDTIGIDTAKALNSAIEAFHGGNLDKLRGKTIYYKKDGTVYIGDDTDKHTISASGTKTIAEENLNVSGNEVYDSLKIFLDYEEIETPMVLQIGETSQKADKLTINLYDLHTDKLFKPTYDFIVTGSSQIMDMPPSIGMYGTSSSSGHSYHGQTQAIFVSGNSSLSANFKDNIQTSSYENAVTLNISNQQSAINNIDYIKKVTNKISSIRGDYGAMQNRLEYTVNNLNNTSENMSAAKSRIKDTDMAKEMMQYTQQNIITQSAQSMLAQANSKTQNILQLLQ